MRINSNHLISTVNGFGLALFDILFVFFSQRQLSEIEAWLLANPLVSIRGTTRRFPCLDAVPFHSIPPFHFCFCFVQRAQ